MPSHKKCMGKVILLYAHTHVPSFYSNDQQTCLAMNKQMLFEIILMTKHILTHITFVNNFMSI